MSVDLRLGRWQDVLADVECDVLISDPPYSARVHEGQRTGSSTRKTTLNYASLSESDVCDFVQRWVPRTRHWFVVFSDHAAQAWWESALSDAGWYVFAPVIWLRTCPTPRLAGDGPTSACDYLTVARPRRKLASERIGSRPGYYAIAGNDGRENAHPGSKPIGAMRALVRDYSRPGDLICDPCAGSGTTLVASAIEGRRAIGAEVDPDAYAIAARRVRGDEARPRPEQPSLFASLETP